MEVGEKLGVVEFEPALEALGDVVDFLSVRDVGRIELEFADVELHGFVVDEAKVFS